MQSVGNIEQIGRRAAAHTFAFHDRTGWHVLAFAQLKVADELAIHPDPPMARLRQTTCQPRIRKKPPPLSLAAETAKPTETSPHPLGSLGPVASSAFLSPCNAFRRPVQA